LRLFGTTSRSSFSRVARGVLVVFVALTPLLTEAQVNAAAQPHAAAGTTTPVPTGSQQPVRIMVLVDESARVGDDQLAALRLAAASIVTGEPTSGSAVAVIGYGSQPVEGPAYETICQPTQVVSALSSSSALVDCAARVRRREPKDGDGADPVAALRGARTALDQMAPAGTRKIVFLFAGAPLAVAGRDDQTPRAVPPAVDARRLLSTTVAREMRAAGVEVWPVGFVPTGQPGQEVRLDQEALASLAGGASPPPRCPGAAPTAPTSRFAVTTTDIVPTARQQQATFNASRCLRAAQASSNGLPQDRPAQRHGAPWWLFGLVVLAAAGAVVVSWRIFARRSRVPAATTEVAETPAVGDLTIYLFKGQDPIAFLEPADYSATALYAKVLPGRNDAADLVAAGADECDIAVRRSRVDRRVEISEDGSGWFPTKVGKDKPRYLGPNLWYVIVDALQDGGLETGEDPMSKAVAR
jgi:hypothetical protein